MSEVPKIAFDVAGEFCLTAGGRLKALACSIEATHGLEMHPDQLLEWSRRQALLMDTALMSLHEALDVLGFTLTSKKGKDRNPAPLDAGDNVIPFSDGAA